jgi:hypothetical protein
MTVWDAFEWAAWIISAVIAVWMIADLLRVSREYDEEFLTTAVEMIDDAPDLKVEEEGRAK